MSKELRELIDTAFGSPKTKKSVVNYQKFYNEHINEIKTEKVMLFGEEKEFYKTSDGQIFGNKAIALSTQTGIIDKKYKDNALDELLHSRRVGFNAEEFSKITDAIYTITKKEFTKMRYEYDEAFKVYSQDDYLDIMDKINTVLKNASYREFYNPLIYIFPEGKSYDIVFLSKSAYKIEYLSVLDDAFKKYKSDYSNLYYFLTKYIDTDNL